MVILLLILSTAYTGIIDECHGKHDQHLISYEFGDTNIVSKLIWNYRLTAI